MDICIHMTQRTSLLLNITVNIVLYPSTISLNSKLLYSSYGTADWLLICTVAINSYR